MTTPEPVGTVRASSALARRFEAIMFDWEGTAVPDAHSDPSRVRKLVESACSRGLELAVVSGTDVAAMDGRLAARPAGPGGLILASDRGSRVFSITRQGPELAFRRTATEDESAALSAAGRLAVERLAKRGLTTARIASEGVNRRRIDLISVPRRDGRPQADTAESRHAVKDRVQPSGTARLAEAVNVAEAAAIEAGLIDPKVTSDGRQVEIGLTDKSDSARWIMRWLWERGIAPEQVLVVGDDFRPLGDLAGSDRLLLSGDGRRATSMSVGVEPDGVPAGVVWVGGGPDTFMRVLEDQIARRRDGELPIVFEDPAWTLAIDGIDPLLERVRESLLTLADGRLGTRGSMITLGQCGEPAVLMSGVYTRTGAEAHLLAGPRWSATVSEEASSGPVRRVLDLRTGLLRQQIGSEDGLINAVMFSSLARPGTPVLRASGPVGRIRPAQPLAPPPHGLPYEQGEDDGLVWIVVKGRPGSIVAAAHDRLRGAAPDRILDRVAAYEGVARGPRTDPGTAVARARRACRRGFDGLLCEHRRAWAERWADADVVIEGDPELQLAVRLALFHLIASVADEGEAAVGARGLTGRAYRGHVFWDSDVYVLPFLAATHPRAARAMLEYRIRRMPAAIRAARAQGRDGARFPWESAWSGQDVTPEAARDSRGERVPILTGELEEHIVADVAWAAACYVDWSGDHEFAAGPGLELLVQTARWWASRVEHDEHGRGHIRGVIGPDEYHEWVDDDAFTNVMARWNLRRAGEAAAGVVQEAERRRWFELADRIVDGFDPGTGIYEQFAGFHRLEPVVIGEVAPRRPVAADLLLGHERIRTAQVVKQADVLMLHYLLPDQVAAGSLEPNLDFYDPRTAHGSTLSPGVHAALLARAGRAQQALEMLRLTARIDLDDIGHLTAGGLHLAAMGSVWRALIFGFGGLRPVGHALAIDPVLPAGWESLELRVRFRDSRVRVRVREGAVEASAEPPTYGLVPAGGRVELTAAQRTFELPPPDPRRNR